MQTMSYSYDHISWNSTAKQWVVHLFIPTKLEFTDALLTDTRIVKQNVCLLLESAKPQDPKDFRGSEYQVITRRHQIDQNGRLFISNAWNIRQQFCTVGGMEPASHVNIPLDSRAVGYATQYDFDKFCFDNPDTCISYDWNAEVYKTFISPVRERVIPST